MTERTNRIIFERFQLTRLPFNQRETTHKYVCLVTLVWPWPCSCDLDLKQDRHTDTNTHWQAHREMQSDSLPATFTGDKKRDSTQISTNTSHKVISSSHLLCSL